MYLELRMRGTGVMQQVSRAFPTSCRWATIRIHKDKMANNQAQEAPCVDPQSSVSGDTLSEDELELHLWQKAFFLDDGSNVRHSADSLRMRLAHLQYCCTKE